MTARAASLRSDATARLRALAALLLLAGDACTIAQAEDVVRRGEIEVHYRAVTTMSLAPEIARRYAITRSPGRGLLSVVILRDGEGGQRSIEALVSGTQTAVDGKPQALALRAVRDGDAISYLAEPRIAEGARLYFALSVTPAGSDAPIELRFAQEFFAPR